MNRIKESVTSSRRPRDISVAVWLSSLFFTAGIETGCGSADGTSDGGAACNNPKVLRYQAPGCGAEAHPICGTSNEDACLSIACGCDGELLTGCDYYKAPWQSKGLCPGMCYSPTQLDVLSITYLVPGCACDPGTDKTQCVSVRGEWHPISCAQGAWQIQAMACEPDTGPSLDGGVDGAAGADAPTAADVPSGQHPYLGTGASCVDYPDVGYRVFPLASKSSMGGDTSWPICPLNCQQIVATAGAGGAPLDQALPAGPCDDEGATCNSPLMAGWSPPCANAGGPGNGYTCVCRSNQWHCANVSQGMNVGDPPRCISPNSSGTSSCQPTWSATQVCACGVCRDLCSSNAECISGQCIPNQVCRAPSTCPGPDECAASCTGLCAPATASKLETGVDRAALVAAVRPQVVQFIRSTQPDAAADTIQLGRPWGEFDVHKGLRLVFRGSWRVLASMGGDYFAVVDVARDGDSYKMTAIGSAQFVATLSARESLPTVSAALDRAQVGLLRCFGEGGDSLLAYQEAEVTQAASQSEIRVQPLSLSDPRFRGLDAGVGELLERSLEEIDPLLPDE
jgi:hypothetical protein